MELKINYTTQEAKKTLYWLISIELLLIIAYIITHVASSPLSVGPLRKLFDLNGDLSIPGWFSSIQLFIVSAILFIISRRNQRKQYLPASFFMTVSLIFLFLSMDEGAAIHEKITLIARKLSLDWMMFKGSHGAWIMVYTVIAVPVIFLVMRYFRTAWIHFRRESLIAIGGATVFIMGAVGFEIISYLFLRSASTTVLYNVEVIFEEFFEMSGISVILYAVLLLANNIFSNSNDSSKISYRE